MEAASQQQQPKVSGTGRCLRCLCAARSGKLNQDPETAPKELLTMSVFQRGKMMTSARPASDHLKHRPGIKQHADRPYMC